MIDLDLWFPEDFDKKYEKYLEKNSDSKIPEPFFDERLENERKHLLSITNEEDFKHEMEKWRPLKVVVDAIYKELSPFLPGDAQIIKIDLSKLGLVDKQASHILMMLAYERICRWKISKSSAVISTESIHEYLGGDGIVVSDYGKFQEFRNKVNDFYKFMEDQKEQKFPPIKKTDTVVDTPEEPVKRTMVWGGETVSDLPLIDYNEATGKGEVVGKKEFKFKDGSPEYKVFNVLYSKLGKKVAKLERQDVLITGEFYKDYEQPDLAKKTLETNFINDIAKNIREKTGLNTKELVMNNGSLTLLALRQDKNPPKVTKYVPVWG